MVSVSDWSHSWDAGILWFRTIPKSCWYQVPLSDKPYHCQHSPVSPLRSFSSLSFSLLSLVLPLNSAPQRCSLVWMLYKCLCHTLTLSVVWCPWSSQTWTVDQCSRLRNKDVVSLRKVQKLTCLKRLKVHLLLVWAKGQSWAGPCVSDQLITEGLRSVSRSSADHPFKIFYFFVRF